MAGESARKYQVWRPFVLNLLPKYTNFHINWIWGRVLLGPTIGLVWVGWVGLVGLVIVVVVVVVVSLVLQWQSTIFGWFSWSTRLKWLKRCASTAGSQWWAFMRCVMLTTKMAVWVWCRNTALFSTLSAKNGWNTFYWYTSTTSIKTGLGWNDCSQ